jgi:hypothetical protein
MDKKFSGTSSTDISWKHDTYEAKPFACSECDEQGNGLVLDPSKFVFKSVT